MTAPTTRTGAAKAGPCTRPHHGPRRGQPASHRPATVPQGECCHMVKCSFVCFFYFVRACVIIFPPIFHFHIVLTILPFHFHSSGPSPCRTASSATTRRARRSPLCFRSRGPRSGTVGGQGEADGRRPYVAEVRQHGAQRREVQAGQAGDALLHGHTL